MAITAKMVKELREKTGVGMMDCKKALQETDGDMDKAVDYLREKRMASNEKKTERIAAEGSTYIKVDNNTAKLLEVNCETDFLTKNDQFKQLLSDLASHLLSEQPESVESALKQYIKDKEEKEEEYNNKNSAKISD